VGWEAAPPARLPRSELCSTIGVSVGQSPQKFYSLIVRQLADCAPLKSKREILRAWVATRQRHGGAAGWGAALSAAPLFFKNFC